MTYTPPFAVAFKPSMLGNAWRRTFAPKVLQVVHVTGNARVAAYPEGFGSLESPGADWRYAALNSASADGPSAHNYVGRTTGATIEMWHPATHVAWSNGDLKSPNLRLPGVKYLADLRAKGINANKGCYREIELSGYPGTFDPTDAQVEACAYFAAVDSIATGLDIVRGETMLTHADLNSVDRQNCAFRPAIRESRMAAICKRAVEIRSLLIEEPEDVAIKSKSIDPRPGVATVRGPGHSLIRFDGKLAPVPDGQKRRVLAKVSLLEPFDSYPGDRQTAYLIGEVPGEPNVEVAYLLAVDASFVADATPDTKHVVGMTVDGNVVAEVTV